MARTDTPWEEGYDDTYIQTIKDTGYNILINGLNKYLNFNNLVGSSGYGFRDNSGVMEFKNSAGAWAAFGSGDLTKSQADTYYQPLGTDPFWSRTSTTLSPLTAGDNIDIGTGSYYGDGSHLTGISASQTPWTSDIDAAYYNLNNVGHITIDVNDTDPALLIYQQNLFPQIQLAPLAPATQRMSFNALDYFGGLESFIDINLDNPNDTGITGGDYWNGIWDKSRGQVRLSMGNEGGSGNPAYFDLGMALASGNVPNGWASNYKDVFQAYLDNNNQPWISTSGNSRVNGTTYFGYTGTKVDTSGNIIIGAVNVYHSETPSSPSFTLSFIPVVPYNCNGYDSLGNYFNDDGAGNINVALGYTDSPGSASFYSSYSPINKYSIGGSDTLGNSITDDGSGNIKTTIYPTDFPSTPSFFSSVIPVNPSSIYAQDTIYGYAYDNGGGKIFNGNGDWIANINYATGEVTDLTGGTDTITYFSYSSTKTIATVDYTSGYVTDLTSGADVIVYFTYTVNSTIATIDYPSGVVTDLTGGSDPIVTFNYYSNPAKAQINASDGVAILGGIKTYGGLPTSDPADGTHTLWADPITHIVYEGT